MNSLDADKEPLYSTKLDSYQSRDIVQFVKYAEHSNNMEALTK